MTRGHLDDDTLTEFAWGELDPDAAEAVEKHLARCSRCRDRVESLRHAREKLRQLAEQPVGDVPSFWPGLEPRLRRAKRAFWWPVAAAAVLALWFLVRLGHSPQTASVSESTFQVLQAEVAGKPAHVFVFSPNDSVTTVWLE